MIWLKTLVVFLTALIVLALGLIGYGFYKKSGDPDWTMSGATAPPAGPAAALKPFSEITLGLAPGCAISRVDGAGALAYLSIDGDAGCNRVIVFDVHAGAVLGTIKARP